MFGKQKERESDINSERQNELEGVMSALNESQAIIEFSPDGTILKANSIFLSTMGYSMDEIQGKHHRLFVSPEEQKSLKYKSFWEKLRTGNSYSDQCCRMAKGGKELWLQASYCPVCDSKTGDVVKVIKYATDITKRRAREADFEGQLAAICRAQAVIEFDMQGNIITANKNFLDTVGYTLSEVVAKHHSIFVHPDDVSHPDYQAFWQSLRSGEFVATRCRRMTKQGKEIWLQATYNPILDPNGTPVKVVKFAMDVSAQKRTEADLQDLVGEATEVMAALADGDLTRTMKGSYRGELMVLANSINQTVEQLSNIIGNVNANVQTIQGASTQLSTMYASSKDAAHKAVDQTLHVAAAAKQISSNVAHVVSALGEMTTSVDQVSSNSSEAASVAEKAVSLANSAKINVNQLAESSNDIGAVIKVINSIADQTNLLALNATIEAARAGDAGKGFAVVANEVKELAKETARATEEVSLKISAIQNDSQVAVKAINDIGSTIESISQTQTSIATNVESQSSVSSQINKAVHDVSDGSNGIQRTISDAAIAANENQTRTENSHATTAELSHMAEELTQLVGRFKLRGV